MKKKSIRIAAVIICVLSLTIIMSSQAFADKVSVVGKVNDNYQIVGEDGTVYEVADTDMGNEMLNNIGKTVEATGTISEEDGHKFITVTAYTLQD